MAEIKLALGCGKRNYGKEWTHIDGGYYEHLDSKNIKLLPYDDNSVDVIYASHVLEYFDREEVVVVLKEWYRVLKIGGKIYISVPDFRSMSKLYNIDNIPLHRFYGPLYGKMYMGKDIIYHKTVYDYSSLGELLRYVGFKKLDLYDSNDIIPGVDDHSRARIGGELISLNMVGVK